jgi:hypothetical protein
MKKLELIVDQPVQGHFYWTVVNLGQAGESHCVFAYAEGPLATHSAAADESLAVLRRLRQDEPCEVETVVLH